MRSLKFLRSLSTAIKNEVTVVKRITQADLNNFTKITGDTNFIHSDEIPAEKRIVHGALLNGLVAGIIGTQLPGPGTVVIAQNFVFPCKCRIDEDIRIVVKLIENRKIITVSYECSQNNQIVFEGNAKLIRIPIEIWKTNVK